MAKTSFAIDNFSLNTFTVSSVYLLKSIASASFILFSRAVLSTLGSTGFSSRPAIESFSDCNALFTASCVAFASSLTAFASFNFSLNTFTVSSVYLLKSIASASFILFSRAVLSTLGFSGSLFVLAINSTSATDSINGPLWDSSNTT